jgi:hypothetical protein
MQAVNKNDKSITKPITDLKKGDKIQISRNNERFFVKVIDKNKGIVMNNLINNKKKVGDKITFTKRQIVKT